MQELLAVRVKDGIFIGNLTAAQDHDFIVMNKITHIINCAGGEILDFFVDDGVKYLTFPWRDTAGSLCTAVMFDSADENIERTVRFIDEALEAGNCVLVHSCNGLSRSPALIAAYFIVKFGWKLDSALSFLEMAHKDMCIKPHFLRQLRMFAKRNSVDRDVFDLDVDDSHFGLDNDQWMLRNTLLNGLTYDAQRRNELYKLCTSKVELGKPLKSVDLRSPAQGRKGKRIAFIDTHQGTHTDSFTGTPVVSAQSLQQLDSNHFIGFHGSVALRSRRQHDSIMNRSITPCSRRAESDPSTNPHGRQELVLRAEAKLGRTASAADGTTSSQVARTASGHSTADGGSYAGAECRHVPPPTTVHAHGRSPFAALTSSHKYRKGSPLPAPTHDKKSPHQRQRLISVPTLETNLVRPRAASNSGALRLTRSSLFSAESLNTTKRTFSSASPGTSTRLSSYKNITPHRVQSSNGVLSMWSSGVLGGAPSVVHRSSLRGSPRGSRPSSPVERPSSATTRVASLSAGALETRPARGTNGAGGRTKGGGNGGVVTRRSAMGISSSRHS